MRIISYLLALLMFGIYLAMLLLKLIKYNIYYKKSGGESLVRICMSQLQQGIKAPRLLLRPVDDPARQILLRQLQGAVRQFGRLLRFFNEVDLIKRGCVINRIYKKQPPQNILKISLILNIPLPLDMERDVFRFQ